MILPLLAAAFTTLGAAAAPPPSLTSFSSGAIIVVRPQEYSESWSAFRIIDEKRTTGWATPKGVITPQTIVIEMPEKTRLDSLSFDTAHVDRDDRAAKDIRVEISDSSPASGFVKIADVSLAARADNQTFRTSSKAAGRWLRLTIENNHGSKEYIELMEVRGFGQQLTHTPFANASGTYDTNYGKFHLRQEGDSVTGCYEHAGGLLTGGIEGRIMKFTWTQGPNSRGPAIMVFTSDGRKMYGLWWYEGSESSSGGGEWDGTRISNEIGSCPYWKGSAAGQMAADLAASGRTRIYGINFDIDSAHIKDESHPTLDQIVTVLKNNSTWKMTIEGHTDSTSTPQHNQQLSEQRAAAVKVYLVAAGIDGARLTTVGYGATKPVGDNSTAIGRAQNRRVELVKQ